MSLLPSDTFVNSSRPFFAALGSGGGGGASTLASPASVTPDVGGTASFSVVADAAGNAVVYVESDVGGNAELIIGDNGSPWVLQQAAVTPSQLSLGTTFNPYITLDRASGGRILLDTGLPLGNVNVNNAFSVSNSHSNANPGLFMNMASATTCEITTLVPTSGTLQLGSSNSNQSTLVVADAAGVGFVEVVGSGTGTALQLVGGTTASPNPRITPATGAAGVLNLGSSATTNPSAIVITDTATTIKNLGGAPQVLFASTNIPPSSVGSPYTNTFPCPVGEGLYSIVGCSNGTSTQNSRSAQLSATAYVNTAGRVNMGGAAFADVGSVGSTDAMLFYPTDGANTFQLVYTGGQQVNNFTVVAFNLSGAIPTTF
jgi:hypothetical protein